MKPLIRLWADAQADLSLRWAQRSFCWFCHESPRFALSHLRQQYRFLLFRGVLFPETPLESEFFFLFFFFFCIHARVCLSPFIMSHCRRVVILLSFTTVDASHCSYSLLVGPRGDIRVVSLMVNG